MNLLITTWREEWGQGEFPFYFVQLGDFQDENPNPGESQWAEIREAQTNTLRQIPNTGQAAITDLGAPNDIHPREKRDVVERLLRWALAKDYGYDITYRSPEFRELETKEGKAVLSFDHIGGRLKTTDVSRLRGFTISGADGKWKNAEGKIFGGDRIESSSNVVPAPTTVRYAWANNPVANIVTKERLPLIQFRTDDFPLRSPSRRSKRKDKHERIIGGRKLPDKSKILSLYDLDDVKVIVRGKSNAEFEFGNSLWLGETCEGFIVDYLLDKEKSSDSKQIQPTTSRLVREQELPVQNIWGDRGLHSAANEEFLKSHEIRGGLCPRNVTDLADRLENETGMSEGLKRRAGTEARISILIRDVMDKPTRAKGFEHRELMVGWAILSHDLWVLARLEQRSLSEEIDQRVPEAA